MSSQTGIVKMNFTVPQLTEIIDWQWLFPPFGIKGKYPDILNDEIKGEEATKLLDEAKSFLNRNASSFILTQRLGIFPAYAPAHSVIFRTDYGEEKVFPFLRQQEKGRDSHFCYSDCFSKNKPGNGRLSSDNLLGMFSSSVIFKDPDKKKITENEVIDDKLEEDPFRLILIEVLCGRLAEAGSVLMEKTLLEKSGAEGCVRPAPGYPSLPDHSLKEIIIDSLGGEDLCGIRLTEGFMMDPPASTAGIAVFDKDAGYPPVSNIGKDQFDYYAGKRGIDPELLRKSLNLNIV